MKHVNLHVIEYQICDENGIYDPQHPHDRESIRSAIKRLDEIREQFPLAKWHIHAVINDDLHRN